MVHLSSYASSGRKNTAAWLTICFCRKLFTHHAGAHSLRNGVEVPHATLIILIVIGLFLPTEISSPNCDKAEWMLFQVISCIILEKTTVPQQYHALYHLVDLFMHYVVYCSERPYAFVLHLCGLQFMARFIGFLQHFKTKCIAVWTVHFVQQVWTMRQPPPVNARVFWRRVFILV